MKDLFGKVAFVTGGASGIGKAISMAFVSAGLKVVIADLRQDRIEEVVKEFGQRGHAGQVHAVRVDVSNRGGMSDAANEAEKRFGPVHVLVNNAGVGLHGPLSELTYADWDFGLSVNLGGVINGLQTFLPRIRAHGGGGHIVNTASLAALVPMPSRFVIYQTAKAAVVTLSEAIHVELARERIGVSVLCPGPVKTNIHEVDLNRRAHLGLAAATAVDEPGNQPPVQFPSMLEPQEVGQLVLKAVQNDEFYIITHGEWRPAAEARHDALIRAMPRNLDQALVDLVATRLRDRAMS